MDSEVHAGPVDSEKVNETEAVATGKSSTKQVPKVARGFVSAPNPC